MPELTVVMPVYNEEGAIAQVLKQWRDALQALAIDYRIAVYNDGSRDRTLAVLTDMAKTDPRLQVVNQPNAGHGPTILRGYVDHLDSPWLFQVDSDGELGPEEFATLWAKRADYDFLIGSRVQRQSPLPRQITTWVSRLLVWSAYGTAVFDVNCPYRLFRPACLREALVRIPADTFAPNLILSGLTSLLGLRVWQTEVVHSTRQTGEVSIKKWKLFKAALNSGWQTVLFRGKVGV